MIYLTDDQILFLVALGAILIVLGLATALERFIWWLRSKCQIDREGDVIEIHAKKANPL